MPLQRISKKAEIILNNKSRNTGQSKTYLVEYALINLKQVPINKKKLREMINNE